MPESPDFEQIAREFGLCLLGAPDNVRELFVRDLTNSLRQFWNARGAADLEAAIAEIKGWQRFDDSGDGHVDVSRLDVTAEGRTALERALRTLDR